MIMMDNYIPYLDLQCIIEPNPVMYKWKTSSLLLLALKFLYK